MEADPIETPDPADTTRGRRFPITWVTLLALGWVLYELTAQPALGAGAVCVKFGWEDFLTARWLRRMDRDPRRGRACFWIYVAAGTAKTAFVALFMTITIAVYTPGPPQPPKPGQAPGNAFLDIILGTTLTMMAGFGLSALATTRAVWLAWRFQIRLWLNEAVHRARRFEVWPPRGAFAGSQNRLSALIVAAIMLTLVPTLVAISILAVVALGPGQQGNGFLSLGFSFLGIIGVPVFFLLIRDRVIEAVRADKPEDCWGTNLFGEWDGWPTEPDP
jgi:hypothetical protein